MSKIFKAFCSSWHHLFYLRGEGNTHTHHISQGNVEEHSACQSEDPVRWKLVSCQYPESHSQITAARWQEVKEQSLLDAHSCVQEDHKVTWAMRKRERERLWAVVVLQRASTDREKRENEMSVMSPIVVSYRHIVIVNVVASWLEQCHKL